MKCYNLNKEINNVKSVKFLLSNVEDLEKINADKIIVDPPRAGLHKKVIRKILQSNAKKIIYVSCYPETQKRDIDILINKGNYKLENIILVINFPIHIIWKQLLLLNK
ncbi:class I SAM-dependent RNA methyltransferase [Candidatus Nanopusillus massiliensis]|uniref:hypothetical protein n=1 Tax=Candidatus Nanopusillus massiliensis TaxID=2897163 RepID=UPI0021127C42|nr:hypothetical protein [Candidatus Nanopusillus massiliensis]